RSGGLFGDEFDIDNTDGVEGMYFYVVDPINGQWIKKDFGGKDGCLEGFGGYKGFIRIPAEYFTTSSSNETIGANVPLNLEKTKIDCFGIWFSLKEETMSEKDIVIDEIGFVNANNYKPSGLKSILNFD
ncbi:MAG: hypothetical protein RR483_05305, partial [Clostridia bacterium]